MSKHRRFLAILIALLLALSACLTAAAETYPTQWDLTEIYPDADAWMADYEKVMEMIPQHEEYRGKLNTAQGLYDYFQFAYLGELTQIQNRLYLYAALGYNLNPADVLYNTLMSQLSVMMSAEAQYSAYVESELYSIPIETRREIVSDPLLEPWAYALKEYVDSEHEPKSEETNNMLAVLGPALGRAQSIFEIMNSVDVPDPMITLPDGTETELTEELYMQIVYGNEFDQAFKALSNETILKKPIPYVNTFAALLEATAAQNWAFAQIDNYESCREAALALSDVDPAIYDMLIKAAREGAPDYQRYLNTHKRGLGLEEQYPYDMAAYVSDYTGIELTFEDAVDQVRETLAVLGDDYIAYYDQLVSGAHLDVYPTDTKVPGAFSLSMGEEFLPYMLFNYVGYSGDVSTIAHEMGHAIYSCYANDNQIPLFAEPSTFTQEVASTTNELLYYHSMMEHSETDDEKLFYLENMLSMFSNTFFMQVLYAEFEDAMYQIVESGASLDAETLSTIWEELFTAYRGDAIKTFPDGRYQWATVPHFYYNYYVYQYATSVAYAASICERIAGGEEGAVENYTSFLKLGGSNAPDQLLAAAGVNPLEAETYQKALDFFGSLVDEYERLVDAKLATE